MKTAISAIEAAISMHDNRDPQSGHGIQSSRDLMRSELTFSSLVARALDRLIFDDQSVSTGACLHQGPTRKQEGTRGSPECPDILIIHFAHDKGKVYPSTPVLVSDLKLSNFSVAENETTCYSINAASVRHNTHIFPVLLALPATLHRADLEVHVTVDKKMWRIPIVSHTTLTDGALLSTLCTAVQYMCTRTEPIGHIPALTHACPYKEWMPLPLRTNHTCRVFWKDNTVYKFFDKESGCEDNCALINSVGALKSLKLEHMTVDKRIAVMSYQYIEGSHKPSALKQFANVVRILNRIHELGYVHGDIREVNIIFVQEGDSVLIDFDLARQENTKYPVDYNCATIYERHAQAGPSLKMKKEHDRYSLAVIINRHFPLCAYSQNHCYKIDGGH